MKGPLRGWRLLLYARCEHASRVESDTWDGPVERDRWWAARLHRIVCGPCQHEHRRMNWLRRRLAAPPEAFRRQQARAASARLSPEAAERIQQALAEAHRQD